MRKSCKLLLVAAVAAGAAVFTGAALHAGDDDAGEDAEAAKVAKDALTKSVDRGKELFHSNQLGKKACASCHENPDKPQWNLATRDFSFPKYSRKKKSVVSMGQKINEMLTSKSGASKEMDLNSADVVAIEAYIGSLKKK